MRFLFVQILRMYAIVRIFADDLRAALAQLMTDDYKLLIEGTIEKPYIAVIALFQDATLRHDIQNLISTLSALNCDVVVVNTAKLQNPKEIIGDNITYIERPNWGRDFGSYQVGVNYVLRHKALPELDRLLILNDSVFYCETDLHGFLKRSMEDPAPVTAVSENHNINWHYGSFFLSFSRLVVEHPLFVSFWKKYQNTNRRQATIRRGEMALSRCLQAIIGYEKLPQAQLNQAMISTKWIDQNLGNTPFLFTPTGPTARHQTLEPIAQLLMNEVFHGPTGTQFRINSSAGDGSKIGIFLTETTELDEMKEYLSHIGLELTHEQLRQRFLSIFLDNSRGRSQIHEVGLLAIACGVPILKLDVIHRGDYSWRNVEWISTQLPAHQKEAYLSLLRRRLYGGSIFGGWRRVAFLYHLL